jgi:8-amino-7-oxononanoate synthase
MAFDPLDWLQPQLDQLADEHLRRYAATRRGPQGAMIEIDGRQLVNFGSNDYLGLAADGRLASAAIAAIEQQGLGSGASPLVTGRTQSQAELEQALAEFEQTEAALVFPSGFAANVGTITALAGRDDVVLSDAKNHASLIDACRLSRAEVRVYRHGDMAQLAQLLGDAAAFRRRFIVTDAVFSMDGDLARLSELTELAQRSRAVLIVDEAHATGVLGPDGRGLCAALGMEHLIPVRIGTLSKAFGSVGGFVVGQQSLIDWLFNRARPFVFSTALPAACHQASLAALQIVREEPSRRDGLLRRAERMRAALRELGWNTGQSASQIIPIVLGDPERTMNLAQRLREQGLFVPGIRPPSVPVGESLLRISLSAAHRPEHDDRLLEAIGRNQRPAGG